MKLWRRLTTEFYGTIMFVFFTCASKGDPLTVLVGLWVCIVGTGLISGAHFNPIVTMGVVIRKSHTKKFKSIYTRRLALYIGLQFVGSVVGALLAWATIGDTFPIISDGNYLTAYVAEIIFSLQLVLTATLIGEIGDSLMLGTLAVCTVIASGIVTVGPVSGGCFNPSFCVGTNIVHAIANQDIRLLDETHLYIIGPLIGGIIGVIYGIFLLKKPLHEQISYQDDPLCLERTVLQQEPNKE